MFYKKFVSKIYFVIFVIYAFLVGCAEKREKQVIQNIITDANCVFEVHQFKQIEEIVSKLQGNVLVVFDNNDVLTLPKLDLLQSKNKPQLKKMIEDRIPKNISQDDYRKIFSGFFLLMGSRLTDNDVPKIINTLQKRKNTKVLLCTNGFHGHYGVIDHYENFVRDELLSLGVDFSKNWKGYNKYIMKNMPVKSSETFKSEKCKPIFWKGMLFSNFVPKGDVFEDFLNHFDINPDVVVFVDDKLKNLYDVKKNMDLRHIKSVLVKFSM